MSAASGEFYVLAQLWLVYLLLSIFVGVALHERMHTDAPYLSHMMLIAALASAAIEISSTMVSINSIGTIVPAQDLSAFRLYWTIKQGLKHASDFSAAWSFLFAGCAILASRAFSRALGWLAVVTGILWILALFIHIGFKQIYSIPIVIMYLTANIWLGIAWLRQKQPIPQSM
jgi:hypothetical protein